jgi:phosphodiesterase/alkaline phosphatase D-like protein
MRHKINKLGLFLALNILVISFLGYGAAALAGDAILTWNPNTEPDLTGYKIYFGTAAGIYGTPFVLGNQTTYTVTGLGYGTYYFTVAAYDTSGNQSGYSNEVSKTFADTTPPVISAIAAGSISSISAAIIWTTNEPATSIVEYGTTTAYGSSTALNSALVISHSATLNGLTASTTYHYRVKSADATGNLAISGDNTLSTSGAPDTTPPTISGIAVSAVTSTGATISWITNESSDTQIQYGTTTAYGSSTTLNTSLVTAHGQNLTGLLSSTHYNFRVLSRDAAGNLATSGNNTVTTAPAPDTTPPVISGVTASNMSNTAGIITWATNESASSQVEYGTTTSYGSSTTLDSTLVSSHSSTLSSLTATTLYHYRVKSADAAGNLAVSGDNTFTTSAAPDTTAPVLSLIAANYITPIGATITWGTDEPASTEVEYGSTTAYGSNTTVNATLLNSHSQTLTGLQASTLYHYRVKSTDGAGNLSVSGDHVFTTGSLADTTPPQNVQNFTAHVGDQQITLSWINPPDSDFIGVRIRYRTDRYPSNINDGTLLGDFTGQPNESISTVQTSLENGVTYYYSASSYDNSGNYQETAYTSATASSSAAGSGNPNNVSMSGGCGMVRPGSGKPSGPGQAADMISLLAVLLIAILKREIQKKKSFDRIRIISGIMFSPLFFHEAFKPKEVPELYYAQFNRTVLDNKTLLYSGG